MFTGMNQREALSKGRKFIEELKDGLLPEADKLTLWQWLGRWIEDYAQPKVRIKTFDKYESCLRCYVKPYLGDIALAKIKSSDLQRVFLCLVIMSQETTQDSK